MAVACGRPAQVAKTLAAVHKRLTQEIEFWSARRMQLKDEHEAGQDVRPNLDHLQRTIKP
ncbi:MAG: hypothetical protein NTW21_44325 [Verrucomicrobia bacterium]|nr:hypothetical protein [Verrucomicrobiota bacterium]